MAVRHIISRIIKNLVDAPLKQRRWEARGEGAVEAWVASLTPDRLTTTTGTHFGLVDTLGNLKMRYYRQKYPGNTA
jgi:hypothetical protein